MYINKLTVYSASGEYKKKSSSKIVGLVENIFVSVRQVSFSVIFSSLSSQPVPPSFPLISCYFTFPPPPLFFRCAFLLCVSTGVGFFSPFLQQEEHSAHGERKNTQRSLKRQDGAIEVLGVFLKSSAGKSTAGLGEVGCFHSDKG